MQTDYSALLGVAPDTGTLWCTDHQVVRDISKCRQNTKLDEDLKDLTPQLISDKDLDECRYQMFQSVFSDVATS
ncbi:hypothetical protein GQ600_23124 [Phytophthora cactorum]|nr:hypothetical protein GQ600_23124 [Phytophthora cactorum]